MQCAAEVTQLDGSCLLYTWQGSTLLFMLRRRAVVMVLRNLGILATLGYTLDLLSNQVKAAGNASSAARCKDRSSYGVRCAVCFAYRCALQNNTMRKQFEQDTNCPWLTCYSDASCRMICCCYKIKVFVRSGSAPPMFVHSCLKGLHVAAAAACAAR
jgi:hypothetical protein